MFLWQHFCGSYSCSMRASVPKCPKCCIAYSASPLFWLQIMLRWNLSSAWFHLLKVSDHIQSTSSCIFKRLLYYQFWNIKFEWHSLSCKIESFSLQYRETELCPVLVTDRLCIFQCPGLSGFSGEQLGDSSRQYAGVAPHGKCRSVYVNDHLVFGVRCGHNASLWMKKMQLTF